MSGIVEVGLIVARLEILSAEGFVARVDDAFAVGIPEYWDTVFFAYLPDDAAHGLEAGGIDMPGGDKTDCRLRT